MLDKVSQYLIGVIQSACQGGNNYVVLEVDEIVNTSPINLNITNEKILNSVKLLSTLNYLNLRYLSDKEFCVSITSSGNSYIKDIKAERKNGICLNIKVFSFCFLGGFLGGVFGGLIALILG